MYKVVLFVTDEVEVVPSCWINENQCFWPSHLKPTQIIKNVEKSVIPEDNWTQYEIKKIIYVTGKFFTFNVSFLKIIMNTLILL